VSWSFLLSLWTSDGFHVDADPEGPTDDKSVRERLAEDPPVNVVFREQAHGNVHVGGHGYTSEEAARRVGEKARSALRLAAVRCRLGMFAKPDQSWGGMAKSVREEIEAEHGWHIRSAVSGLDVFETPAGELRITSGSAVGLRLVPMDRFLGELRRAWPDAKPRTDTVDDDLETAIDLLLSAEVESNERAQFLSLVTALELLCGERSKRTPLAVALLDRFISEVRDEQRRAESSEVSADLTSLADTLGALRVESIGHTIKKRVADRLGAEEYGGMPAADFAHRCFGVRSKTSHAAKSDQRRDTSELRRLIVSLVEDRLARAE
jgi:hypothetical protein